MSQIHNLNLTNLGIFLEKLAEKSQSVYWLSSSDLQKIQYISPSYEKIWGRSRNLLYANPELWIEYLHPEDRQCYHPIQNFAKQVTELGSTARYEEKYRIIRPNGEVRWILDRGFPIYDDNNQCCGVTGIALDITTEKQIEENLRQAKEAAEAASHAKTEFLHNMRHDLRTPLTGIMGYINLIKAETKNPQIIEYANDMLASSQIFMDMMNEILEAIRIAEGQQPLLKKKFALIHVLDSVMLFNQGRAKEKKLILTLDYDTNLPCYFVGDFKRLQKIILELVANALTFTHHGNVSITVKAIKNQTNQTIVQFAIKDTGIGIPADRIEEIFLQFNRLHPAYQGMYQGLGLGLSIVKHLINELGGEIYVDSQLQQGSSFRCLIPLQVALTEDDFGVSEVSPPKKISANYPIINASTQPTPKLTGDIKVLLVEDDPRAAKGVMGLFKTLNCQVSLATTGQIAIDLSQKNTYDLIFMDIGLPDMSGYDVTRRIRKQQKNRLHTPIISLSAHIGDEDQLIAQAAGINVMLSKPLKQNMAVEILNEFVYKIRLARVVSVPSAFIQNSSEEKVIDMQANTALLQGDLKLAKKMLQQLIKLLPRELKDLAKAYQSQAWETLADAVHKLHGGLHYCGTPRLLAACANLENYLRRNQAFNEQSKALYAQVLSEAEAVQKAYVLNF